MVTTILLILFSISVFIETSAYAIYEITVNKNKLGGIILIVLAVIGLVFPISIHLSS